MNRAQESPGGEAGQQEQKVKAALKRAHSKRFARFVEDDSREAFGVRASLAPLSAVKKGARPLLLPRCRKQNV